MDKYYYFVSQLPALKFNEKPRISRDYFLTQAREWLGDFEFKHLESISLDDFTPVSGEPEILTVYKNFEYALRRELAVLRQAKNQASSSPLEAEKKWLLWRWNFIQEQESGHNFDLAWLILYFLKLKILERLLSFDKDKGLVRFDQLCAVNL